MAFELALRNAFFAVFCAANHPVHRYVVFPNEKIKIRHALPGAVFAAIGWLVFSKLYSVYVVHFSSFAGIYDSLYSLALGLLWLYFCISIVFYGGVLNRYRIQKKSS